MCVYKYPYNILAHTVSLLGDHWSETLDEGLSHSCWDAVMSHSEPKFWTDWSPSLDWINCWLIFIAFNFLFLWHLYECFSQTQNVSQTISSGLRSFSFSSDPDCDVNGVRWRPPPELPAGLCRVAAASDHRVSLLLPGGSLLPVHLWDRGGRPLPLLRHRHQVQRRHSGKGVLHGQSSDGETAAH